MKNFRDYKIEAIREAIKSESRWQKSYKEHIRDNKEGFRETNNDTEKREYIKINNAHRARLLDGKKTLTYLHQEYNMLKGKDNSHSSNEFYSIRTGMNKFECERFIIWLDYDSFEFSKSTYITYNGYLAGNEKIEQSNIMLVSENEDEALEYYENLLSRVEEASEMKALRIVLEQMREENEAYEKRKKNLDRKIINLKKQFDAENKIKKVRRLSLSEARGHLINKMYKIKKEMLLEAQNAN